VGETLGRKIVGDQSKRVLDWNKRVHELLTRAEKAEAERDAAQACLAAIYAAREGEPSEPDWNGDSRSYDRFREAHDAWARQGWDAYHAEALETERLRTELDEVRMDLEVSRSAIKLHQQTHEMLKARLARYEAQEGEVEEVPPFPDATCSTQAFEAAAEDYHGIATRLRSRLVGALADLKAQREGEGNAARIAAETAHTDAVKVIRQLVKALQKECDAQRACPYTSSEAALAAAAPYLEKEVKP
jgi:hypothetical protein